jgi:hypothetical protein
VWWLGAEENRERLIPTEIDALCQAEPKQCFEQRTPRLASNPRVDLAVDADDFSRVHVEAMLGSVAEVVEAESSVLRFIAEAAST